MRLRNPHASWMALAAIVSMCALVAPADVLAQKEIKPGFNIFSREQEIQLGQQASQQVERQLPMLRDSSVEGYVDEIVDRLKRHAPGHQYPYQSKVVNAADVNAFALPGGYMYVNRGLIQAARTEGELAGVLAHEMAHVALRHATHQASKAYATQTGIGVLGGLLGLGRARGAGATIANIAANLGMNALVMKFSRDDEHQADLVGARMMHAAGYNPADMASFFDLLQSMKKGNPNAVAQFFASHPSATDRAARIRTEARRLGPVNVRYAGGLQQIQSELRRMGPAPTMAQIQRGQVPRDSGTMRDDDVYRRGGTTVPGRVEAPSGRFRSYEQRDGFFTMQYPDNWRVYEAESGLGVTISPEGGIVEGSQGEPVILYGVIVNHYDPFDSGRFGRRDPTLAEATDDLIAQLTRSNPHLRRTGSLRRGSVDGAPALQTVLQGRSQYTRDDERVTVVVRELPDGHLVYTLFVAPARDYGRLSATFDRMIDTLRVNDSVAHR